MTDIFHDAYASVVAEKERLKTQLAALAAENERRTEQLKQSMALTNACIEMNAQLTAENERLRKAGDAMYNAAVQDSTGLWLLKPFENWNAAKEGGAK